MGVETKTSIVEKLGIAICCIIATIVLLYNIGLLIQEAREETRLKIIEAVEVCYDNNYSIVGPVKWEILDCIKNAKIK